MIKLHRALLAGALLALASVPAQAASIVGSLPLNGFDVTQSGTGLNLVSATATKLSGPGLNDFAAVTSDFGGNTVDVSNLGAFTFTGPDGTFAVTGTGSGFTILSHTNTLLDIFFVGTYSGLTGFDPTLTSARVTINLNGGSLTEGIVLAAPPATPEPASVALAGIGLAGLGLVRVLRKRSV